MKIHHSPFVAKRKVIESLFLVILILVVPLLLAYYLLGLNDWDMSVPLLYNTGDAVWQFALTKFVTDTGWVLTNPYLGAPEIAHWHNNAAAQTSALHSLIMLGMTSFIDDAVKLQQVYYVANFPLICFTSYLACRLLGVSKIAAYCVGILFAFTTFRIGAMHYAFLSNYFTIPLAVVPIIWLLSGKFSEPPKQSHSSVNQWEDLRLTLKSGNFKIGIIFIGLVAVSDGYYAFFTLLLLGFATFARALLGDWKRPLSLLPAGIFISTLLICSLALTAPIYLYKKANQTEFYPNGAQDPSLIKHRFEAEVYSSSLKLLVTPIPQHQVVAIGKLGQKIVDTSEAAREFKIGSPLVPLGTLATLLFVGALILLGIPSLRKRWAKPSQRINYLCESVNTSESSLGDALLALSFFIFITSISGGLGTLIALIFPTIRGYDRFPLFLIFVLYLGAALFVTRKIGISTRRGGWIVCLIVVTGVALYDQIPNDAAKGNPNTKALFLAERRFVQEIERMLPHGAMVYQYPYSQYLRESKHYGWGSFAGIRLYLHSHQLRWSNGGAKNSPADDWNLRISQLAVDQLTAEVEAVGFQAFVIDRTVITGDAYESIRKIFSDRGYDMLEDTQSKFTMIRLRDPGYRMIYDQAYQEPISLIVHDVSRFMASDLPAIVNNEAIKRRIGMAMDNAEIVITKREHPGMFFDSKVFSRGNGEFPINPITDMHGELQCSLSSETQVHYKPRRIQLTLENKSAFHWAMGVGPAPIELGVHFRQPDGQIVIWDNGFRVSTNAQIKMGESQSFLVPLNSLELPPEATKGGPLVAEFELLQEGVAWFNGISCKVPLH
jgi:hypothetical protein